MSDTDKIKKFTTAQEGHLRTLVVAANEAMRARDDFINYLRVEHNAPDTTYAIRTVEVGFELIEGAGEEKPNGGGQKEL